MKHSFTFEKYSFEKDEGRIELHYLIDGESFVEVLRVPVDGVDWDKVDEGVLDKALFNLHLAGGVSYWKAYCPKDIQVKSGVLSREQAAFWNKLYTLGLGEFYYTQKIDFRDLVHFPFEEEEKGEAREIDIEEKVLLPVGGGKDSLVSAEILEASDIPFTFISSGNPGPIQDSVALYDTEHLVIERKLDQKLLELNKEEGVYNGHVPITAYNSFLMMVEAILYRHKYIAMSLERSANYGQVMYLDVDVNHQHSKSFVFEKDFGNYIHTYVTPSVEYFSLLRPFYEVKIAKLFAEFGKKKPELFTAFASCNRNFHIGGSKIKGKWCAECPKCAFVYTILAAHLPKDTIISIFGEDMFENEELLGLFKELLELQKHKPFECVGTKEEMRYALLLASQSGEFKGDFIMNFFEHEVLPGYSEEEQTADREKLMQTYEHPLLPEKFTSAITHYS